MPFTKLNDRLKPMELYFQLTPVEREILEGLRAQTYTPAHAAFLLFPGGLGTGSHAVYALAKMAIWQHGETTAEEIAEQARELIDLVEKDAAEATEVGEKPTITNKQVTESLNHLVGLQLFTRTPSGKIKLN